MTDRQEAFEKLAKKYEARYGVKVDFELYAPSDVYSEKIIAAAQGQNLPDIYGILAKETDFAEFIKAGDVLNLTSYMDANDGEWKNSFFVHDLAVNEFISGNSYGIKPGIYGVPIDSTTLMMVYNKDLFKQLGLDPKKPPKTFRDFLDIGKKIKKSHIQGMVFGGSETWMLHALATNYAFNIMGKDKFIATIKGEVVYTDPDWIKVFGIFKELKNSGIVNDEVLTMVNKIAEGVFTSGRAVFAYDGSWCVNVYKSMNPSLNYGVMLPPKFFDKHPMSIWGGAGSSFMVNGHSKNKDKAIKFLKWLTQPEQQTYLTKKTLNLPANKNSLTAIPPILSEFARNMDLATHPNTWGVSEFSQVSETFDRGIQSIIIGEKTPEQVANEVQITKNRVLSEKRVGN